MQPFSGHHVFLLTSIVPVTNAVWFNEVHERNSCSSCCQLAWAEPEIVTIRWTRKKAGSSIWGANKAITFIMLNWSTPSAGNEHTLLCWLMRPTDKDIFNWDLFCVWTVQTANLKIKTAKSNQATLPDGNIYLWKQKCSSNKDWEQLSATVAFKVPEAWRAPPASPPLLPRKAHGCYIPSLQALQSNPQCTKDWLFQKTFQNNPTVQKCTVLSKLIHVCASFTSFLSSWLAMNAL